MSFLSSSGRRVHCTADTFGVAKTRGSFGVHHRSDSSGAQSFSPQVNFCGCSE